MSYINTKCSKLFSIVLSLLFLVGLLTPLNAYASPSNTPYVVDGRILTPEETGDTADWVEIAQSGGYSLIVRSIFIDINVYTGTKGNYTWQKTPFGSSTSYSTSTVRNKINDWFNGTATGEADRLPTNARLRSYTMQNNAINMIGTTCNPNKSLTDGLSTPSQYQVGIGNDIAFALSYSEAANFCSQLYFMRELSIANQISSSEAIANYNKIYIPQEYVHYMWLRSPGDVANTAGCLSYETPTCIGRVFQMGPVMNVSNGFVYPALWVDSRIFEYRGTVTGRVWPMLAGDIWGIGEAFVRSHDVIVELRSTFLTPAPSQFSTRAVLVDSSGLGEFTFENVPVGEYILHINRPGYLTRAMLVSVTESSPSVINLSPPGIADGGVFRLWWGDSNDDGRVDNEDVMMILELMNLSVNANSPLYYAGCDFNGDGLIDNEDIQMVLEMWNRMLLDYPGSNGVDPFR
ncbi:MAG: dockerin type I domain-containing protein [Oscillospiraceae bacterium]|nr:dockerin type I domain-containing protein [Oscillospiraceae bacterium]